MRAIAIAQSEICTVIYGDHAAAARARQFVSVEAERDCARKREIVRKRNILIEIILSVRKRVFLPQSPFARLPQIPFFRKQKRQTALNQEHSLPENTASFQGSGLPPPSEYSLYCQYHASFLYSAANSHM